MVKRTAPGFLSKIFHSHTEQKRYTRQRYVTNYQAANVEVNNLFDKFLLSVVTLILH